MARIVRDPLAHFLMLGAVLWLVMAWRGEPVDPTSRAITITRERQAALAANFEQLMARPPTERELAGLVATDIREEVLVREALRLGLDRDDPVIRRRLAAKMDEIAAAEAESAVPSDAILQRWLTAHPERFSAGTVLTFSQALFGTEAEARAALGRSGNLPVASREGSDLPQSMTGQTAQEIARFFGLQFASTLTELEPAARWQGPIPSGVGWHLVRLERREPGRLPRLAEVREQVLADWRSATMATRREASYRMLADGYSVIIAK